MKNKVSDYIADFLVSNGVTQLFSVVGGGAMHLNDSFGHKVGLNVIYNHHEQASAIAAEAYARMLNKPAAVCVTSGPGATNAITGCLCAWMGSIPMVIFSGQVRYPCTVRAQGLELRTNGEQEYDICKSISGMTKYCAMVTDPKSIKYHLEKALFLSIHGRPGPVWLDIPVDIQSAIVDTDELLSFDPIKENIQPTPFFDKNIVPIIVDKISKAKRPLLYCGLGIRLSGAMKEFESLITLLGIPVVTSMTTLDYIGNDNEYYAGRPGVTGDRPGNFAVQNSDLVLFIGTRLSYKQTGYNFDSWAPKSYKIMVDIDENELKRTYLNIDMPICADAKDFITSLIDYLSNHSVDDHHYWIAQCKQWIKHYPVVTKDKYVTSDGRGSIYVFYDVLSMLMPEGGIYVTTSGNSRVVGRQVISIKKNQRVITNHSTSPMGYCLPASIGACVANNKKPVVLITGEGGFQMNIQELQTIKQNKLPVHIVVINNEGYHSIRITQNSFFANHSHVGIGEESHDLSFPDLSKIAYAYGYKYFEAKDNIEMEKVLSDFLACDTYCVCQVFVTKEQVVSPKASSKLINGSFVSQPLENMAPFLPEEEIEEVMSISKEDKNE